MAAAILDVRNSLSIAFLTISYRYGTFILKLLTNGRHRPFFMSINHFRLHFWSILDFRNSLSITFLAISHRYRTFVFGGHFGYPKITFDRNSGHFRLIGHLECLKFTLDRISGYFRSIWNCYIFYFCLIKWPPVAILDVRRSHSIAFLAISMSIELVRDTWMSNACVKFEERSLNPLQKISR